MHIRCVSSKAHLPSDRMDEASFVMDEASLQRARGRCDPLADAVVEHLAVSRPTCGLAGSSRAGRLPATQSTRCTTSKRRIYRKLTGIFTNPRWGLSPWGKSPFYK